MIRIRLFPCVCALMPLLLMLLISSHAQAQPATATRDERIDQLKALQRVEASYPDGAKDKLISGIVVVEIVISEEGKVTSTRVIMGHPLLRPAAVEAAKEWEFEIPILNGEPTKLVGAIAFCFLATKETTKSKYTLAFERCCPEGIGKPDDWCIKDK